MLRRIILLIAFITVVQITCVKTKAGGPLQPEVAQFEPVDVTDVVNLQTGDFVYTIPLFEVPGPEGGYPLVLSYHSGIGPNQDATWVGLGWTLNPGSINRAVNGFPDDYNGDVVETNFYGQASGLGIGIGIGYGPVGLNVNYDSHEGLSGSMSIGAFIPIYEGIGVNFSVGNNGQSIGLGYQAGLANAYTASMSIGVNSGVQGFVVNAGLSKSRYDSDNGEFINSYSLVGFSFSSGNNKVSLNIGGLSTMTQPSTGNITEDQSSAIIPIWIFDFMFSAYRWEWKLTEHVEHPAYGYLHQKEYLDLASTEEKNKRYEIQDGDMLFASQDIYTVNAQGMNGNFKPYFDIPYFIGSAFFGPNSDDPKTPGFLRLRSSAELNETHYSYFPVNRHDTNYVTFKFLGEGGNNFISIDDFHDSAFQGGQRWGKEYEQFYDYNDLNTYPAGKHSSKRIDPEFDITTGKLKGFFITDIDGKLYEYTQKVNNIINFTRQEKEEDGQICSSSSFFSTPYSTSWLLTAIKGPDYVDRDGITGCSDGDWGYWVKFSYKNEGDIFYRNPSADYSPSANDNDWKILSYGRREYYLLKSIETPSHVSIFSTEPSLDRPGGIAVEGYELQIVIDRYYNNSQGNVVIEVNGNWFDVLNSCTDDDIIIAKFAWSSTLDTQYRVRDIVSKEFNQITKRTVIIFSDTEPITWAPIVHNFVAGALLNSNNVQQKNLTQVNLYLKNDPHVYKNASGFWVAENEAESIKGVKFNDLPSVSEKYLLCPGTPNSNAESGRKYTLRNIQFTGPNGDTEGLPKYEFGYNPDQQQSWFVYNWDRWGSLKSNPDFDDHMTPQNQTNADFAAYYELRNITLPTKGTLSIEYEADDYYYVSDCPNIEDFQLSSCIPDANHSQNRLIEIDNTENIFMGCELNILEKIKLFRWQSGGWQPIKSEFFIYSRIVSEIINNNTIRINQQFPFQGNWNSDEYKSEYSYEIIISRKKTYGGGIRVKSISSTGSVTTKTTYKYVIDETNNVSSGVTASLPARYHKAWNLGMAESWIFSKTDEKDRFEKFFTYDARNYCLPAPGVIYSKVIVENVNGSGNKINGRTEFEFYTAQDHPTTVPGRDETTGEWSVKNRSAIYGLPKKTTYFDINNNLVKEDIYNYAFSDMLNYTEGNTNYQNAVYYKKNNSAGSEAEILPFEAAKERPLGMIQEKYIALTHPAPNTSLIVTKHDIQTPNVYLISTETKNYVNNGAGFVKTEIKNLGYDVRTGAVIVSAAETDNNKTYITKIEPAYWKYTDNTTTDLYDKNMLTQKAVETLYFSNIPIESTSGLIGYTFPAADIKKSTVTTWNKTWVYDGYEGTIPDVWRVNDTYEWIGTGNYAAFTSWSGDPGNFVKDGSNILWKRTSNITMYDRYSHPVEERSIDGTYTSSIYGYGEALPVALAANAKRSEISYSDFEDGLLGSWIPSATIPVNDNYAHTGEKALYMSNSGHKTVWMQLPASKLNLQGRYTLSAWARASGAEGPKVQWEVDFTNGSVIYPTYTVCRNLPNQWQYIETTVDLSQYTGISAIWACLRNYTDSPNVSYEVYFDDVRIYPDDGSMSTYCYDPLTWKLTAITDNNNITTYYEYDSAGRLTAILDQDRKVKEKYRYNYATSLPVDGGKPVQNGQTNKSKGGAK